MFVIIAKKVFLSTSAAALALIIIYYFLCVQVSSWLALTFQNEKDLEFFQQGDDRHVRKCQDRQG